MELDDEDKELGLPAEGEGAPLLAAVQVVPGFYEPVFNLDEFPAPVFHLMDSAKTQEDNNWNAKNFIESALQIAIQVAFGQSKASGQEEVQGKVMPQKNHIGESLLLNEMRAKPLRKIIPSKNNPPRSKFVEQIQSIRAVHKFNSAHAMGIFNALKLLKDSLDEQTHQKREEILELPSNPVAYPPHYDTFFPQGGSLQTQLASFFRDYSDPTVSQYNQNSTFLSIKKQSRHYVPEANALVDAINALQTIAKPGVKIIYQGRDINTPDEKLREVLQAARADLVKKTEGRWTQSHLLRRIDFALEKIAERNQPKPPIENQL